jgi:hypothetical protein
MSRSTLKARCMTAILTAGLALSALAVQAQPGPKGPGMPRGPAPLAMLVLDPDVHAALSLTTAQETQWSALKTAEQSFRTLAETDHANSDALIAAELAKTTPDLIAIENATTAAHQSMTAAAAAISAQAIALYSTFNTGQQAVVVTAAQAQSQRVRNHLW